MRVNPLVPASDVATDPYCLVASSADLARYRRLVRLEEALPVNADTITVLQAAHLDAFPYSNLDSMLGRRLFARLEVDNNLRGDEVPALVSGISSGMRHRSEYIDRVDIAPIGGAKADA